METFLTILLTVLVVLGIVMVVTMIVGLIVERSWEDGLIEMVRKIPENFSEWVEDKEFERAERKIKILPKFNSWDDYSTEEKYNYKELEKFAQRISKRKIKAWKRKPQRTLRLTGGDYYGEELIGTRELHERIQILVIKGMWEGIEEISYGVSGSVRLMFGDSDIIRVFQREGHRLSHDWLEVIHIDKSSGKIEELVEPTNELKEFIDKLEKEIGK